MGFCEHGNETACSIKEGKLFINQDFQIFNGVTYYGNILGYVVKKN
jgi:hypothetical protein